MVYGKNAFAVRGDRIFDATGQGCEVGKAVIVEDNLIVAVVPVSEIPHGMSCFHYPGCTLLPGLIDTHVHIDEWMMPMFLAYGVTTIRDTGNDLDYVLNKRHEMEDREAMGPDVVCCGPALDGMPYFHPVLNWGIESPDDMESAIRFLKGRGVNAIKLYVGLDRERIERAVKICSELDLHLLGHFQGHVKLSDAVRYGVSEVEHLYEVPPYYSEEIVDEIIKRNVWVVPTQVVWEGLLIFVRNHDILKEYLDDVPEGTVKDYWRKFFQVTKEKDPDFTRLEQFCENNRRYIEALIRKGGRIVAGSDAPCQFVFPGLTFYEELRILGECGMSNRGVLRSATSEAAKLLRVDSSTGTLEKGKLADMLVVEGDPVKDLKTLKNIKCIYKKGMRYSPESIFNSCNPGSMSCDNLPDIYEKASEFVNWKKKYLSE